MKKITIVLSEKEIDKTINALQYLIETHKDSSFDVKPHTKALNTIYRQANEKMSRAKAYQFNRD
jgi:hypothetical protein